MKALLLTSIFVAASLQLATAQSTIFLVRHAEKTQDGDAKDPELSEIGHARAESLARILRNANITTIYATEFKRTQQTAEPIGRAAGVEVTMVPAKEGAAHLLLSKRAGNALVVGHSNTLPDILKAIGVTETISIADADYDDLFIVSTGEKTPTLIHLHYANCNK